MKNTVIKGNIVYAPPLPNSFANELLVLDRGKGSYVYDITGKKYIDFASGIAVTSLGHGNAKAARIAGKQMKKLSHTSNLFTTLPVIELGKKMTASAGMHAVHFGNSGAEANETALKFARLYSLRTKGKGHEKFLCFDHGFHGRTFGAMSVTSKKKYTEPYGPLVEPVVMLPYNDIASLEKTLDSSFALVIVEVIQGEGGIDVMTKSFAEALNTLCKKHDVILIADEVQTGIGRAGYAFASTMVGLKPDIITLAKPIAGGLPLSACLIAEKIDTLIKLGEHGTTFGGGPVTTAIANYIWDTIQNETFLKKVRTTAGILSSLLDALQKDFPSIISEVKGTGMLRGLVIGKNTVDDYPLCMKIKTALQDAGLLVLLSGESILRLAPPLNVSEKDLTKAINIIYSVLNRSMI